jgi:hypothetical protein
VARASPAEFAAAASPGDASRADTLLRAAPDEQELRHLAADPWGRALLIARGTPGRDTVAMLVQVRQRTPHGTVAAPSLVQLTGHVTVPAPHVRALVNAAAGAGGAPTTVLLPNLTDADAGALGTVGIRRAADRYVAFVASSTPDHPLQRASATNLEVT